MTNPEHALVGMHVAVAFGLQHKLGWLELSCQQKYLNPFG